MSSTPPFLELTIARESVSQKRYVPPFSCTHASVIASNKRPAEVISAANGGKNQVPGFSSTSDESEKLFSPENTLTGTFVVWSPVSVPPSPCSLCHPLQVPGFLGRWSIRERAGSVEICTVINSNAQTVHEFASQPSRDQCQSNRDE
jgi:hypothetical protein